MGNLFEGKTAVVTGAGRGIGREVALAFGRQGAKVVAVDPGVGRDGSGGASAPADEVVSEIRAGGGTAIASYESVADFVAAQRVIKACVDAFGRVDILYNGAGVLRERMIFNMSEEEWDTVITVHLKGTFNMTRHAAPVMKEQKYGRIINVTSDAWRGTVGQSNYGAAKAGIVGFTRAIAREMGRLGVTCNALCPLAATRMTMTEEVKAGFRKRWEAGIIARERYEELVNMPGPEYVAPAALFIASDAAVDLNGQVIGISGGQVSIYSQPVQEKVLHRDPHAAGLWTAEELCDLVPKTLLVGYVNPAPAAT